MILLASYQLCLANAGEGRAAALISIYLAFGKYFARPLLIPRTEPQVCSLRHRRFCARHRKGVTHQIVAPRGKYAEHSQSGQQRHGDVFCSHSFVPFLGYGYVLCIKGRIVCTSARAQRLLTAELLSQPAAASIGMV